MGVLDFFRKRKQGPKVSAKVRKRGDLPYYSLTGLMGILLYVEEIELLPDKFSPSGRYLKLKIRSAAGEEAFTSTDKTPLILYFQGARLPLRGHFVWREGSFDIMFLPK